jgi:excisionase family DNA binding protein
MAALCDMLRQEPTERGDPADSGDDVDMGLVLDAGEVAAALKVSQRTAERLIASGELPSVLIGRSRRVTGEDLKEFLVKLPRAIKEDA